MAVSSWRRRKDVMWESGAVRRGVVRWRRKRGRRDSRRARRERVGGGGDGGRVAKRRMKEGLKRL